MAKQYRVKEVFLNKDGSNIWFYPQVGYSGTESKGMWWWKTTKEVIVWENYYEVKGKISSYEENLQKTNLSRWLELQDTVVAFRNIDDASKWINSRIEEDKKDSEIFWKNLASRNSDREFNVKVHDVKVAK
jgi:hypothetical protein